MKKHIACQILLMCKTNYATPLLFKMPMQADFRIDGTTEDPYSIEFFLDTPMLCHCLVTNLSPKWVLDSMFANTSTHKSANLNEIYYRID